MLLGERLKTKVREFLKDDNLPSRKDRINALRNAFPELTIVGKGGEQVVIIDPENPNLTVSYLHHRFCNPRHLAVQLMVYHLHKIAQVMAPEMVVDIQYVDTREMKTKRKYISGDECTNPSQYHHIEKKFTQIYSRTGKFLPILDYYLGNFVRAADGKVIYIDKLMSHGNLLVLKENDFDPKVRSHIKRLIELQMVETLLVAIYQNEYDPETLDFDRFIYPYDSKSKERIVHQTRALYRIFTKYHQDK